MKVMTNTEIAIAPDIQDRGIELSLRNSPDKLIISEDDYELLAQYKWSKYFDRKRITVAASINGKLTQLYHLLLGHPKCITEIIVHKNGNYLDKRRSNIEYVERKTNFTNTFLNELPRGDIYGQHPLYTHYKADKNGTIYNIITKRIVKGTTVGGYQALHVKYNGRSITKQAHVFIYECFNDIVEKGYEIDHIDNNKLNNALQNLQALSIVDHKRKTRETYPDCGKKTGIKLAKAIIAINIKTKEETSYNSLSAASLAIPGSTVTKVCMVLKGTRLSHQGYTFRYKDTNDFIEDEIWVCLRNPLFKYIEVSNLGRVKTKYGVVSYGKLHLSYMRVSVTQHRKPTSVFVHRLVCEAFHGKQSDTSFTVDHIDRNKVNNNEINLRWASKSDQRLNAHNIKKVKTVDEFGNIRIFDCVTYASRTLNMDARLIKIKCDKNATYNGLTFGWNSLL
jgi:hypothetical protein